jgi:hypothetical protein
MINAGKWKELIVTRVNLSDLAITGNVAKHLVARIGLHVILEV